MLFFSSDPHFGHANIIRFCKRPYYDVESMNVDLVERWNSVVGDDDEVYLLGDVALGDLESSLEWVSMLNGTITMVPGNHDRCWQGKQKEGGGRELYEAAGLGVVDNPEPIMLANRRCLLGHFPYVGDKHDTDRFVQWRPKDRGEWLLHGHGHEKWRQRGRMINVGVDAWGGYPVSSDALTEIVGRGPQDLEALQWGSLDPHFS